MKIKQSDIITDRLPEIREVDGYTNVVLALWKDENYCESNTYIPKWHIVITKYYNTHPEAYQGWIELEDDFPPKELM